jgi:hypothetical protein
LRESFEGLLGGLLLGRASPLCPSELREEALTHPHLNVNKCVILCRQALITRRREAKLVRFVLEARLNVEEWTALLEREERPLEL